MALRPICEPVELPIGVSVIAERISVPADAAQIGSFVHFHDVAELVIFGRVRGEFIADHHRHRLYDGSVVFVPSMRRHDFGLERGAMDWVLVQIDPYVVERLGMRADLSPLSRPFCAVPVRRIRARIEMLGEWLVEASSSGTPNAPVERIIELLLLTLVEAPPNEPASSSEAPAQSERLLPALERLRTTPSEPLRLETAATLCRVSPTYFSRRFHQLFGMTFSDYSRVHRLHLAARRLVSTGAGISEIAFGVGFSSPAHFTARFRERFGITPRDYRASARARAAAGRGAE
ncbi:MAG TPA: AraC family transcriptional regulator [Sphingomicrobium sp.]|jgi:AraC-like DNA-binding protein